MSPQSRVTVKDVARLAGVSPGTVSNALSRKRPVSVATRQKVLDAIAQLDYHPNLLARGLVNRQSSTLAVVATGLEYYGPSRTLVGIEAEATRLGYSLLLDLLPRIDTTDIDGVLGLLTARRVDGIIWAVHEVGANRTWVTPERLAQLPPLLFLTMEPRADLAIVSTDNQLAARLATEHLLATARRKVGIVTGPLEWWEARERLVGWRAALELSGRGANDSLIAHGNWSAGSGERALGELLERHPDLDAIFACNDQMALGIMRAAHLRGLRIPDDLALVGCDNVPESAYFWPSLTTIRQHLTDVGRRAVQRLHAQIDAQLLGHIDPAAGVDLLVPELIVRESSGVTGEQTAGVA